LASFATREILVQDAAVTSGRRFEGDDGGKDFAAGEVTREGERREAAFEASQKYHSVEKVVAVELKDERKEEDCIDVEGSLMRHVGKRSARNGIYARKKKREWQKPSSNRESAVSSNVLRKRSRDSGPADRGGNEIRGREEVRFSIFGGGDYI